MKSIIGLTDYKNNFGSKHFDSPYRSGMDKTKLIQYFREANFEIIFIKFSDINIKSQNYSDLNVIYTSSEDPKYYYKDFIEDIVFALQLAGARVIPDYKYLRANNNKVFMELLREIILPYEFCSLKTIKLGAIEELLDHINQISYPVVVKGSQGASGNSVYLAKNKNDLFKKAKEVTETFHLKDYLWELGRSYKHDGYIRDSTHRKKFIIQEFVPNLKNDWKVLVFGKRYFILTRYNRKNDFRASGSNTNYKAGTKSELTHQILDYAKQMYDAMDLPHVSMDIAFDGKKYYLLEIQAVYFGTSTINMSDAYFVKEENNWSPKEIDIDLEKIYADSISEYITNKI